MKPKTTALELAQRLNLLNDYLIALASISHLAEGGNATFIQGLNDELKNEEESIIEKLKSIEIND